MGNDVYTQVVCFCEWADETLPKVVTITNSYGNPQTILKRAFKQEPTSIEIFGGDKLKSSAEAKQYKVTGTDLENEGCRVNRKGGMAVERYWLSFVEKIDNQNKEKRKQEWVKNQDANYVPEVKSISEGENGEGWSIKTSFKFAKRSSDTLSHYRTVWQDTEGELYGFNQSDMWHRMWCPSTVELWSSNPEKLEMENVKEGVEKAVNKVIQNASWFQFCWLGKYHSMKTYDWERETPNVPGMNMYKNTSKDFYNNELSKKLPLKLVKWEKVER